MSLDFRIILGRSKKTHDILQENGAYNKAVTTKKHLQQVQKNLQNMNLIAMSSCHKNLDHPPAVNQILHQYSQKYPP